MKKLLFGMLILVLVTTSLLFACKTTTTTEPGLTPVTTGEPTATTSAPPPATQANWWDKFGVPQYGGDITVRGMQMTPQFDPYMVMGVDCWSYDTLFFPSWTVDRNEWSMSGVYTPEKYMSGHLAESWELTDQQTLTVHLHQGVHWQNKEPVNGREFTSEDVIFHYDRILGTGHGYTTPSPYAGSMTGNLANVTATDKYTVQFHLKTPCGGVAFMTISDPGALNSFEAQEWVALGGSPTTTTETTPTGGAPEGEPPSGGGFPAMPTASGPLADWKQVVGTGPWLLSDFITNSSATWSKNPDYWSHDPRYPQNQTPYLDSVKQVVIEDIATQVASLRTGKIDFLSEVDWEHDQTLNKLNLQHAQIPEGGGIQGGWGVTWRNDLAPFSDIRVRKALDMAIDRQVLAQSLDHGLTDGKPVGAVTQGYKGYCYAYDDWPQSLKDEYAYNPTKAQELLAEAGYPDGFKTDCTDTNPREFQLLEAFKDYFKKIGVDMEIKAMDPWAGSDYVRAGKHSGMATANTGFNWAPNRIVALYYSGGTDAAISGVKYAPDPVLEDLYAKFQNAGTSDEISSIIVAYDKRVIEQHYGVFVSMAAGFNYWQPYLKGYSMEVTGNAGQILWSRLWVDSALK